MEDKRKTATKEVKVWKHGDEEFKNKVGRKMEKIRRKVIKMIRR